MFHHTAPFQAWQTITPLAAAMEKVIKTFALLVLLLNLSINTTL